MDVPRHPEDLCLPQTQHLRRNSADPLTFTYTKNLGDYYRFADGNAVNDSDLFRVYVDQLTLQPGEYKVFTPRTGARSRWSRVVKLNNSFNYQGGFADEDVDWSDLWPDFRWYYFNPVYYPPALGYPPSDAFTFEVIPNGKFSVRYSLNCWPGDQLPFPAASTIGTGTNLYPAFDLYNNPASMRKSSTGHRQYRWLTRAAKHWRPCRPDAREIPVARRLPARGHHRRLELSAKTARENTVTTSGTAPSAAGTFPCSAIRTQWPPSPTPTGLVGLLPPKALGTVAARPVTACGSRGPTGGMNAWAQPTPSPGGGNSRLPTGGSATRSTARHLHPHRGTARPPTSLGQYTHANFNVRDQQPLFGVGNSFANPQVDPNHDLLIRQ
ncbi:hypothetical protein EMGBD4_04400 [Verrucomicrobiota bacterium]|nr:hypothetical protein EMGBD4_04400 [Verrucomicrobiota bacterium]